MSPHFFASVDVIGARHFWQHCRQLREHDVPKSFANLTPTKDESSPSHVSTWKYTKFIWMPPLLSPTLQASVGVQRWNVFSGISLERWAMHRPCLYRQVTWAELTQLVRSQRSFQVSIKDNFEIGSVPCRPTCHCNLHITGLIITGNLAAYCPLGNVALRIFHTSNARPFDWSCERCKALPFLRLSCSRFCLTILHWAFGLRSLVTLVSTTCNAHDSSFIFSFIDSSSTRYSDVLYNGAKSKTTSTASKELAVSKVVHLLFASMSSFRMQSMMQKFT